MCRLISFFISVNLVMDRLANRPRGFAFLRYETREESKKAIEGMHGKVILKPSTRTRKYMTLHHHLLICCTNIAVHSDFEGEMRASIQYIIYESYVASLIIIYLTRLLQYDPMKQSLNHR